MDPMNEQLTESVHELVERAEITDLAVAYCWTIDGHDWDGLDRIFTPDATADFATAGVHDGREGIKQRIQAALGSLDASQHLVSNH